MFVTLLFFVVSLSFICDQGNKPIKKIQSFLVVIFGWWWMKTTGGKVRGFFWFKVRFSTPPDSQSAHIFSSYNYLLVLNSITSFCLLFLSGLRSHVPLPPSCTFLPSIDPRQRGRGGLMRGGGLGQSMWHTHMRSTVMQVNKIKWKWDRKSVV